MAKVNFVNAGAAAGVGQTVIARYPAEFRLQNVQMDLSGPLGVVAVGSAAVYVEEQAANAGPWVVIGKFSLPSHGHIGGVDTGAVQTRTLTTDAASATALRRNIQFRFVCSSLTDELHFTGDYSLAAYE